MSGFYEYLTFPLRVAATIIAIAYFGRDCQRSTDQRATEMYKACIAAGNQANLCERAR